MSALPVPSAPGWPVAFRGYAAIAAGLVSPKVLRGPRYLRVFPDTYVRRDAEPPDLRLRSLAAYRHVEGRGVLPADEIIPCRGVRVTSPARTAYDLGRQPDLVEAVVGIDAVANVRRFDPADVLALAQRHPGRRGSRGLRRAVSLADRRAGSPMETRLRLILVLAGLPRPEAQFPVLDDRRRRAVWLDLAYPEQRIGIEYEGADHGRPERVLLDAGRYTRLVDAGWRIYRFTKYQVYAEPHEIVAVVRRALVAR